MHVTLITQLLAELLFFGLGGMTDPGRLQVHIRTFWYNTIPCKVSKIAGRQEDRQILSFLNFCRQTLVYSCIVSQVCLVNEDPARTDERWRQYVPRTQRGILRLQGQPRWICVQTWVLIYDREETEREYISFLAIRDQLLS